MLLSGEAEGQQAWARIYGGSGLDRANSIQQTTDGGYIVAGNSYSFGAGQSDVWVIKMNSSGDIDASCSFINTASVVTASANVSVLTPAIVTSNSTATVIDTAVVAIDANLTSSTLCANGPLLISHKPSVDDSSSPTPNGIIETDETTDLAGTIDNEGINTAASVSGLLTTADPININIAFSTYPDIAPGTSGSSLVNYKITAPSANRPSTHWDFTVTETTDCSACYPAWYDFTYHVGNSFSDVVPSYLFYSYIETLLHSGVTAGCTTSNYCPDLYVSRDQMAKFVCAAMQKKAGGSCTTSGCTGIFTDVSGSNIFCPYIEALYNAGIVSGCSASPLMYCPDGIMERQAMAKFICLAMEAVEPGSCSTAACAEIFADVPSGNIFCSFIEGVYNASVVSGCQASPLMYCPSVNVTRAQMSKFIINAFSFSL